MSIKAFAIRCSGALKGSAAHRRQLNAIYRGFDADEVVVIEVPLALQISKEAKVYMNQ